MEIKTHICLKCGHGKDEPWVSRLYNGRLPKYCPMCKSGAWQTKAMKRGKK